MNSQSPIPRTDAAWEAYCIDPDRNNPWDFAEQLERELQEAIGYANRLVEHKSMVCLPADLKNLREANAHFAIEIEELKKERDEARKLAERYRNLSCDSQDEADETLLPWETTNPNKL